MITEIPTAEEFYQAGLNQIYLAWQIAMQVVHGHEGAREYAQDLEDDEAEKASAEYWSKSQPLLANAFGLIQQAMEMALKGKIAGISPYLLISRDPKDWPSGVDVRNVPFSEFRTLDAADLVKAHNTFAAAPLSGDFRAFWDEVRRDRNKVMHSVSAKTFDFTLLLRSILIAVEALFSDTRWPQRLLSMEADGKLAAYGIGIDGGHNVVMAQVATALDHLTTSEKMRFFGFDSKRRSYICPICLSNAERDWQDTWPLLAQFVSKDPNCTSLRCILCEEVSQIKREACKNTDCKSNVIYEGACLICTASQDSPSYFRSDLEDASLSMASTYSLRFRKGRGFTSTEDRFRSDGDAIEHARRAMEAVHLRGWEEVGITLRDFSSLGSPGRSLGAWERQEGNLVWHEGREMLYH